MSTRGSSKGMLVLFCVMAMIVAGRNTAGAAAQLSVTGERSELMLLHDRLSQNLKAEALIQKEIRNALSLAARPHSAYLLHQESLGLQSRLAALTQVRQERRDIYREVALLNGIDAASFDLMRQKKNQSSKASVSYSGAPLLSFYSRSGDGLEAIQISPFWTGFFRVITGLFLLSIFSLPLIAIYKREGRQQPERERGVLFPIFTVQSRSGNRGLLRISPYRGER